MAEATSTDGRRYQVAVDIGGTFTDVVLIGSEGALQKAKVLSSPPQYGDAVIRGLRQVMDQEGIDAPSVDTLLHAMTVATNAVLEGRGAPTALVTTKGFRDILELSRGRRPTMYDLSFVKPKPLVRRRNRFEIDQRIMASGELAQPVTDEQVAVVAERLERAGVQSVAVCLVNSYVRPDEERKLVAALQARFPDTLFTASVDLASEIGEYERTSTAVVNAYIMPAVDYYLRLLETELERMELRAPFYIMQSNGGLIRASDARRTPAHLIESGPAAGVIGVRTLARELGLGAVVAFDMGGTTAKAALIERGEAYETPDFEVGAGMNAKRGLNVGAGHTVLTPTLDIAEVGAGGGSIFWIDPGGSPRVGPESAGASPGPACYGRGGELPTLSDANLALGYLNPASIAGQSQPLHPDLAEAALATVAEVLGLSVEQAAYGAYSIAVANMTRLLKTVTSERGRDPRDAVLVAFGGAGPAYAVALAQELEIRQVIVPPAPGLFSAVGLLASEPQHDATRPYLEESPAADRVDRELKEMEAGLLDRLVADGYARDQIVVTRSADMRYKGQKGIINVAIADGDIAEPELNVILDGLDETHFRMYRHHKARPTAEIVNLRVRATCRLKNLRPLTVLAQNERLAEHGPDEWGSRDAYFGADRGWLTTPVVSRGDLAGDARRGPIIVEELDSTTVIPPEATVCLDGYCNLVIDVDPAPGQEGSS